MLYYPPPLSRGPLSELLAHKAFLERPDHYLSPKLCLRLFARTHTNIRSLEKCSTTRYLLGAHCFSF